MFTRAQLGSMLLSLGLVSTSFATAVPYTATILQAEVEVRSLPGTKEGAYPTNRLRMGARVEVVKERDDGWLEIKPPPGSFSWIGSRFVEPVVPNQANYVVIAYPNVGVPVLMGSELIKARPTVVGAKLQRGAQVHAIGKPLSDEEGIWLPIDPPASEVRYLRAEAIAPPSPPKQTVAIPIPPVSDPPPVTARVASSPGQGPLGSFQNPTQAGSALAPITDVDSLYQRAIQAERAGNVGEAIRLYTQVGNESATSNRNLAMDAYNRAHFLREANRMALNSTFVPAGQPATTPTTAPAPQPPVQSIPTPARLAPPVAGTTTSRQAARTDAYGNPTSGPGRLRVAGRSLGNQRMYVLEDQRGIPVVYASPQPGVEMESFVGRAVELYGTTSYQGQLRANYMAVSRVVPLE